MTPSACRPGGMEAHRHFSGSGNACQDCRVRPDGTVPRPGPQPTRALVAKVNVREWLADCAALHDQLVGGVGGATARATPTADRTGAGTRRGYDDVGVPARGGFRELMFNCRSIPHCSACCRLLVGSSSSRIAAVRPEQRSPRRSSPALRAQPQLSAGAYPGCRPRSRGGTVLFIVGVGSLARRVVGQTCCAGAKRRSRACRWPRPSTAARGSDDRCQPNRWRPARRATTSRTDMK